MDFKDLKIKKFQDRTYMVGFYLHKPIVVAFRKACKKNKVKYADSIEQFMIWFTEKYG